MSQGDVPAHRSHVYACIRSVTESGLPRRRSHDENPAWVCVLLYTLRACTSISHMTEPAPTRGHLTAFLITCTSTPRVKNALLPPSA